MSILDKLKDFFGKLFSSKEIKMLEAPKTENNLVYSSNEEKRKKFTEELKNNVAIKNIENNDKVIESFKCINDGTGYQVIKE